MKKGIIVTCLLTLVLVFAVPLGIAAMLDSIDLSQKTFFNGVLILGSLGMVIGSVILGIISGVKAAELIRRYWW